MRKKRKQFKIGLIICALLFTNILFAQKQITGSVSDPAGQPIVGSTIAVKGSTTATQTDGTGHFKIEVPGTNSKIVISSVGFDPQEITVGNKSSFEVSLKTSLSTLNEVVVTGYGSQKKKDITGAVAIVDVKQLKAVPVGNPDQLLQGQAAGVQVISTGQPGATSQINVRGITSFGNNTPLYIIDGVQGNLHDINPDDIASIQVLKDAGSAAIYGVQGSNGVIVVTTKKGVSGNSTINYDGYVGVQEPLSGNPLHLLNTPEMMQMNKLLGTASDLYTANYVLPDYMYSNQTAGVRGIGNTGDPAVDPSNYVFTPDHSADYLIAKINKTGTDWFHEVFKPALQQSHTITASGGYNKSNYLFSFNYLDQDGTMLSNYLKRYSVRINTSTTVKNIFRVGENVYAFYKENPMASNQWENSPLQHIQNSQPIQPVYDIEGNYAGSWDGPSIGNGNNPVADLTRMGTNKGNTWDVLGNVYAELDIMKHLTARTSFGGTIDNQYSYNFGFTPYEEFESHNLANSFSEQSQFNSTWLWTNTLRYSNVFAEKHSLTVLVGSEAKDSYGRGVGGSAGSLSPTLATDPNFWILNNGTQNITNYSYGYTNSLYSLFSRLDYSFEDKYLIGATIRRDGASVLAAPVRYGTFPSVSLGWRISSENFMKSISWINELKLRASWGKLGSVLNVNPANSLNAYGQSTQSSFYSITGSSNSSVPGYLQTQVGNAGTSWEQDEIKNIGVDALLFGKLSVTAEYFIKSVDGLLAQYNFPAAGVGFATYPVVNGANTQNKGVELTASYHNNINKDWKFDVGVNFTSYQNKVLSIPNPGYFDAAASRQGNLVRNLPGEPIGSFYGYKVLGLFKDAADVSSSPTQTDAAPGRFKFADINGPDGKPDGVIDANDRTVIGNPNPKFTYGINMGVSYKSWSLSTFFYGSEGNDDYNYTRYWTDFYGSFSGTKSKDLLYNSWTPQNLGAKTPILEVNGSASTNNSASSYFVENGSFLKCRYLKLAYDFSPGLLKNAGINRLTFYIQAVNLFTITKYTGLDPELLSAGTANGANPGYASSSSFGIDYGNYPNNQKSYIAGVSLSF
jgi:TonB-dependent starch-binding outer membrane protein SusC